MKILHDYYPLITVGAAIGLISVIFITAYALMKNKKKAIGFDRTIRDGEIIRRLAKYAKPYWKSFVFIFLTMIISCFYNIFSPLFVGKVQEIIKVSGFDYGDLLVKVILFMSMVAFSLLCSYFGGITLQKTGQKIISNLREDLFTHIEGLSHNQLYHIPVGKLVTRVTYDTNGISMVFTNILVTLFKNIFVILGVFGAMLLLNYELTLMVLCFVPFIVLFTVVFRKFSRKAYREVKDCTTDINTFLSENLSGIKITQIFNKEDKKMNEFSVKNNNLKTARSKQIFVFSVFRPLVYMLYITSVLCLFFLGGKGYLDNVTFLGQTMTSEIIVSFYMYISEFFNPIQNLAEQFNRDRKSVV